MKKVLLLLSVSILLLLPSCSLLHRTSVSRATIGDKCYLNVTIFQALNSHEALAKGSEMNSIVVKLITTEDAFFDGKVLMGEYIMVDTYTYTHKTDGKKDSEEYVKTVPVFIKVSEYNAAKPLPLIEEKKTEGQKL